jgi:preprotein translocase subunit SecF
MTNFRIIQKRNIWLSIALLLFVVFTFALFFWGLKFGIDFTGGSLLEVKFSAQAPTVGEIQTKVGNLGLSSLTIQPVGNSGVVLRFQESTEDKHQAVVAALKELALEKNGQKIETDKKATSTDLNANGAVFMEEIRFDSVGPSIGQELKRKSVNAVFFVLVGILLYISYAFRKISKPVASWKYGSAAIIAMFHDVVITLGVFAVLGKYLNIEINTSFVAAALTVMGYSVHDTIVVFDRIRENLPKSNEDFEGTVNHSLNQTLVRSVNTSLTTLVALLAVLFFGGESIRTFALALTIGIFIGTYSSIFVAPPLLVFWEKFKKIN